MDSKNAEYLNSLLGQEALVVDVGGGGAPFPRADHIIDLVAYEDRCTLCHPTSSPSRYTKETWHRLDLCDHRPWPFPDKFFDFATCSHVLEDIRDPVWVCSEMCRIAKAGYIEVPSRIVEQSLGVENPRYAGYCHHRWLIDRNNGCLEFRLKPHLLHSYSDAIVTKVGIRRRIKSDHSITWFVWNGGFEFREVFELDESGMADELRAFAYTARSIPDLTEPNGLALWDQLRRAIYFHRLKRGRR